MTISTLEQVEEMRRMGSESVTKDFDFKRDYPSPGMHVAFDAEHITWGEAREFFCDVLKLVVERGWVVKDFYFEQMMYDMDEE